MVNHVANSPRRVDKTAVLRFSAHGLRIEYGKLGKGQLQFIQTGLIEMFWERKKNGRSWLNFRYSEWWWNLSQNFKHHTNDNIIIIINIILYHSCWNVKCIRMINWYTNNIVIMDDDNTDKNNNEPIP